LIFFNAEGRFGNQLFQYAFLKNVQNKNELIITTGFDDLFEVFEDIDLIRIFKRKRYLQIFASRAIKYIFNFLSRYQLINTVKVIREPVLKKYTRESVAYETMEGLFQLFTLVKPGYFQSEQFFQERITKTLHIRERYTVEADLLLKDVPVHAEKIFVHIRRGDYKGHSICGRSSLLPLRYFKEQIAWFTANKSLPFFIFLSDEPAFICNNFSDVKNKIISSGKHFGTDLAIMTKCENAILSPSSFGWWGSYLMQRREMVIAPRHWLGFGAQVDYHTGSTPSYAKEVTVRQ
jgi:hypothetical protein